MHPIRRVVPWLSAALLSLPTTAQRAIRNPQGTEIFSGFTAGERAFLRATCWMRRPSTRRPLPSLRPLEGDVVGA